MAYPLPLIAAPGRCANPPTGLITDRRKDEDRVPLVGPVPEFEGGLVTAEELRVLLGRDDDA